MTFLVERLAELRRHLDHLAAVNARPVDRSALERDMSLRNDVLFSLLMVAQLVIDIAGELSTRQGIRFEDYTEAVKNLGHDHRFTHEIVDALALLPGFRNVVIHDYVVLDLDRVVDALQHLDPVRQFLSVVVEIER
jgi:uncharacterized protein YutE (UPF0331/DUF86 family)